MVGNTRIFLLTMRIAPDVFLLVDFQHTLFTELRELVAMEDRGRFDELVYRRDQYTSRVGHRYAYYYYERDPYS